LNYLELKPRRNEYNTEGLKTKENPSKYFSVSFSAEGRGRGRGIIGDNTNNKYS